MGVSRCCSPSLACPSCTASEPPRCCCQGEPRCPSTQFRRRLWSAPVPLFPATFSWISWRRSSPWRLRNDGASGSGFVGSENAVNAAEAQARTLRLARYFSASRFTDSFRNQSKPRGSLCQPITDVSVVTKARSQGGKLTRRLWTSRKKELRTSLTLIYVCETRT